MQMWNLILTISLGVVLAAGFGLSVWNFYRHGRAARIALAGYLFVLLWYWTLMPILIAFNFPPPNPSMTADAINRLISLNSAFQSVFPLIGLMLLTRAAFTNRPVKRGEP